MSRREFLERLNELLKDIPREEREEAMQYYDSYFEDAGEKKDADIIEELGSPEKVAEAVKADFSSAPVVYEEPVKQKQSYENTTTQGQNQSYDNASYNNGNSQKKEPWTNKPLKVILLILLLIVASPAIMSLFSIVFGLFIGLLAICFAFAIVAAVGIILGIILLAKGTAIIATTTGAGLLLLGFGLLGIVIGIILFVAFVKGCLLAVPFLFRKIKELIAWIRRKIGGR